MRILLSFRVIMSRLVVLLVLLLLVLLPLLLLYSYYTTTTVLRGPLFWLIPQEETGGDQDHLQDLQEHLQDFF